MSQKKDQQTVQKIIDYMKANPYATRYPGQFPAPPNYPPSYQQPTMPANPPLPPSYTAQANEKDKKHFYPYSQYYPSPYYPNYGMPMGKQPYGNQIPPPSFYSASSRGQQGPSSEVAGQTGMNHSAQGYSSQYPYGGYPYYPYSTPYPYGMYPPYYYNRPPGAQMYPPPPSQQPGLASSIPPSYPLPASSYLHPLSVPVPAKQNTPQPVKPLPTVKQEIVISSDQEINMRQSADVPIFMGEAIKREREPVAAEKTVQEHIKAAKELGKQIKTQRYKRIRKQEKEYKSKNTKEKDGEYFTYQSRGQKQHKQSHPQQRTQRKKHHPIAMEGQAKPTAQQKLIKDLKDKIADSLKEFDNNKIKISKAPQDVVQTEEKMNHQSVNSQKEQKKEKPKDEHPLKELRYSESHGRIRLGNCYQSAIPDMLPINNIALFRQQMQHRLKSREISAITFLVES